MKLIASVLIIVAVGIAGFLIGRDNFASKYQTEQALNYKLNRSELDGLGEIDEVLQTAFGEDSDYDGVSYRLEPGISRKQVLVPAITDILESYPKE